MLDVADRTYGSCIEKLVGDELLAQGAAIDAENFSSLALVAAGVFHNCFEQGLLDLSHDELVELGGTVAVQACQIATQRMVRQRAEGLIPNTDSRFGSTLSLFLFVFLARSLAACGLRHCVLPVNAHAQPRPRVQFFRNILEPAAAVLVPSRPS